MSTNKLIIEGTLPSLNEYVSACRSHARKGAKMKKSVEEDIMWQLLPQLKNKNLLDIQVPTKITFTWIEDNKKRDLDNIASAKKFILDSLVSLGVLKNDNRKNVSGFIDEFPEPKKGVLGGVIIEFN